MRCGRASPCVPQPREERGLRPGGARGPRGAGVAQCRDRSQVTRRAPTFPGPRPLAEGAAGGSPGKEEVTDPVGPSPTWSWCAPLSALPLPVIYPLVGMGHGFGWVFSLGCAGVCAVCFLKYGYFSGTAGKLGARSNFPAVRLAREHPGLVRVVLTRAPSWIM